MANYDFYFHDHSTPWEAIRLSPTALVVVTLFPADSYSFTLFIGFTPVCV